jgi:hypothetical protein
MGRRLLQLQFAYYRWHLKAAAGQMDWLLQQVQALVVAAQHAPASALWLRSAAAAVAVEACWEAARQKDPMYPAAEGAVLCCDTVVDF